MKTHEPARRLHLVKAAPAPEIDEKEAHLIAEGLLKFQTLQDEFDQEALSGSPDLDRVAQLVVEMSVVRERLQAHGVRVRG